MKTDAMSLRCDSCWSPVVSKGRGHVQQRAGPREVAPFAHRSAAVQATAAETLRGARRRRRLSSTSPAARDATRGRG